MSRPEAGRGATGDDAGEFTGAAEGVRRRR
jgi:hypothetical protein